MSEMADKPKKSIEQIIKKDGRYPMDAVYFIQEGLSGAVERYYPQAVREESSAAGEPYHVSGQQLCHSLRDLAQRCWGLMARQVLEHWNITCTRDFGELVFLLVNSNWMQKAPEDNIEDFEDVIDFTEAFDDRFEIELDS